MKLYEFFGNIKHDTNPNADSDTFKKEEEKALADQLFWFIIDNDKLHKEEFLPLAKKIKAAAKADKKESGHDWKLWMPMVKKGCEEFYKRHDVQGHPNDVFNKEFREDLCKRLADHSHKDIVKGEYKI